MSRKGFDADLLFTDNLAITADGDSSVIDLGAAGALPEGAVLIINFGAVTGTTPTLDITVQESDDNFSSDTTNVFALPQYTDADANTEVEIALGPPEERKRYLKLDYNTGGTTPSFTLTARLAA